MEHQQAHRVFGRHPTTAVAGWDYLLDPVNIPLQVEPGIEQILARIDGRHNLQAVLEPASGDGYADVLLFFIRLVMTGLIVLSDEPDQNGAR